MSQGSAIEWTDATWNPVRGCVKVSPGCAHCYAETFAERFRGVPGHPYEQGFDLRLVPEKLMEPLSWKKPRRVFVNSMSDLFQDGVLDSFIDQVFAVMALCPQHTFQVLTKRAERMRVYLSDPECFERVSELAMSYQYAGNFDDEVEFDARDAHENLSAFWPLPNVWLGVSCENQHFADERIPLLLQTPAAVRFISAEPLLGPLSLRWLAAWDGLATKPGSDTEWVKTNELDGLRRLDWVIVGGESGPGARPFDLAWARSIVQQCLAAGVPVFVKQLGKRPLSHQNENDHGGASWAPLYESRGGRGFTGEYGCEGRGKKADMAEWPEDLRVREFPAVRA